MRRAILHATMFAPLEDGWGLPLLLKSPPGAAKCLGLGTLVLMYDGRRVPVEEVRVGDLLMGPDSEPRTVLATSRGIGPLYEIVPIKGESWICNDVHVLTLASTDTGELRDIALNEYLRQSGNFKHRWKLVRAGVNFPWRNAPLPIDPYFLGVWYGDGKKDLKSVTVSKPDAEIEALMRDTAEAWDLKLRVDRRPTKCPNYVLTTGKGPGLPKSRNKLMHALREVVGDGEQLPHSYLTGTHAERSALLAGLLDTDGHLQQGCFSIVQKRRGIADGIRFLARSLGLHAVTRERKVAGNSYWSTLIAGDMTTLPLRIARKTPKARRQNKNVLRTGFSVRTLGQGEYAGFVIDGDHRFLLGDFTITHNTAYLREYCRAWGLDAEVLSPGERGDGAFGVVPVPERRRRSIPTNLPPEAREVLANLTAEQIEHRFGCRTVLTYPPPEWAERFLRPDARGVVFLDELFEADEQVRKAMLGLIHGKRIGAVTLAPGVRIIAAGNDPDDVGSGYDLPAHVANRLGHLDWSPPTVDEHVAYMRRSGAAGSGEIARLGDAADEEARVLAAWPEAWARAVQLEESFLRARPSRKNLLPGSKAAADYAKERAGGSVALGITSGGERAIASKIKRSGAWPSDRSWSMATRALASSYVHKLSGEDTEAFVAAFISEPVAEEWFNWIHAQDLPNPAAVLDGAVAFVHDPDRVDRTAAVFSACVALAADPRADRRKERITAIFRLVLEHGRRGRDLDLGLSALEQMTATCKKPDGGGIVSPSAYLPRAEHVELMQLYKGLWREIGTSGGVS